MKYFYSIIFAAFILFNVGCFSGDDESNPGSQNFGCTTTSGSGALSADGPYANDCVTAGGNFVYSFTAVTTKVYKINGGPEAGQTGNPEVKVFTIFRCRPHKPACNRA